MQKLIFSLVALVLVSSLSAQQDTTPTIKLLARYKSNTVQLRWFPTNATNWRLGNKYGYKIERMVLGEEAATFTTIATVKPYTANEWSTKADLQNDFVRGTKEAIEKKLPMPNANEDFNKMLTFQNDENGIFLTFILCTNLNQQAADGAALKFTDKDIVSGKAYAYKLSLNNGTSSQEVKPTDAIAFMSNTKTEANNIAPIGFRVEEEEGAIKLFWDYANNRTKFSAYYIERSSNGGKTFEALNKIPLIITAKTAEEISYTDSVKNYIPYQYRVKGVTAFGDNSNACDAIAAMGKDKTPAIPASKVLALGDRNKIAVSWEMPTPSKDLKGFYVARGASLNGPFNVLHKEIIDANKRIFIDEKPLPKEPYYMLYTLDTAKNVSNTFSIMANVYDSVAPQKPMALLGKIDSTGIVALHWKFGTDNDLQGYHIFTATGKNNVYHQLTGYPLTDSVFVDTVNMRSLDKEVYYKIIAVDYNNNPSPYSEILELKRPDIIAPSAPIILAYAVVGNKVTFSFEPSSSKDVVQHQLTRKDNTGMASTLFTFTTKANNFTDTTATDGADYTYQLIATDESGLQKSSLPLVINIAETTKQAIENLEANYDAKEKQVDLKWHYNATGNYSFVVFKQMPNGLLKPMITLAKETTGYADNNIETGTYSYAVKVIFNSGAESNLSKAVSLEIK